MIRLATKNELDVYRNIRPPVLERAAPAPMAVRAGDLMRTGDDLRLALELAETALALASASGASEDRIQAIRGQLALLRRP